MWESEWKTPVTVMLFVKPEGGQFVHVWAGQTGVCKPNPYARQKRMACKKLNRTHETMGSRIDACNAHTSATLWKTNRKYNEREIQLECVSMALYTATTQIQTHTSKRSLTEMYVCRMENTTFHSFTHSAACNKTAPYSAFKWNRMA